MGLNPMKTGLSRVFLIEGRARPDHAPAYHSNMRMGALSRAFGDVERIEAPDPDRYDNWIEVGETRGARERAETNLEGRYALDLISEMLRLANSGCAFDVQLHMGQCQSPSYFNDFTKALILENVRITNFGTDDLGALESGDNSPVNENIDISASDVYEVMQMTFVRRADSLVTVEVVDVTLCGSQSCGSCSDENSGCDKIFAVTKAAGGSPSTQADLLYSLDKGATWYAHDIESMATANDASGVACSPQYLVVVSNAEGSLHYALLSEFDGVTDPDFTEVSTGFVAGGEPNDIVFKGTKFFIVGDLGYVYVSTDPTAGVDVQDAGVATVDNLNAVDALSDTFAVAVGNSGAIIKTEDGETWGIVTPPTGVGAGDHLLSIAIKNEDEWLIGTNDGRLFYTNNGGETWTQKSFTGDGAGTIDDIVFATKSVVFMAHANATPRGRILRSYDGGQSWQVLPEGIGTLPTNDRITALAACAEDPNFVVGVGLADNASDGIILVGTV